ncbi:L,D-transpeptidase [Miltoncostaea oceani]|uniref:L,D-transpeptidase n=1 Tax=Miltoncostaea oceani TaxID=2843216 RepID=UPI001C3E7F19|nr:L,D-transpeptidase [Miltoncostaea oceani]
MSGRILWLGPLRRAALGLVLIAAAIGMALIGPIPSADGATARPPAPKGTEIARVLVPLSATSAPGAGRVRMKLTPTGGYTSSATKLAVTAHRVVRGREYLQVILPMRPNGSRGWIPADLVRLHRTTWSVHVRVSTRTIEIRRGGRLIKRSPVVVGKPSTPTPYGTFAVREIVRQPGNGGFYGPWVLTLTAYSNVLERFAGGPGLVAIHGRGGAALSDPLGSARSHGCIRIPNGIVTFLAKNLEAGVPVRVTR